MFEIKFNYFEGEEMPEMEEETEVGEEMEE